MKYPYGSTPITRPSITKLLLRGLHGRTYDQMDEGIRLGPGLLSVLYTMQIPRRSLQLLHYKQAITLQKNSGTTMKDIIEETYIVLHGLQKYLTWN